MNLLSRTHEFFRSLIQMYGSQTLKTWLWDKDFSRGRYGLHTSERDVLYPFLEKYTAGGSILDLGCGVGNTASEIRADAYSECTGVDISEVAIRKAKTRSDQNGRNDKNHYLCGDILSYIPAHKFNVILFRDSIYYLPKAKIKATLDRYSNFLVEGGVFILRVLDGLGRYKRIIGEVERNFTVIERHVSVSPNAILLVFRGAHDLEERAKEDEKR